MTTKTYTEQFVVRLRPETAMALDQMALEGGYNSRGELVRSILVMIVHDDAKAHGAPPQPLYGRVGMQ